MCYTNELYEIAKSIKDGVGIIVEVVKEEVSHIKDKKVKADGCINSSILDKRLNSLASFTHEHLDEVSTMAHGYQLHKPEVAVTTIRLTVCRGRTCCIAEVCLVCPRVVCISCQGCSFEWLEDVAKG